MTALAAVTGATTLAEGAVGTVSTIAKAIQGLYRMGEAINDYIDKHIEDLKSHDNPTISRTGRVLEAAKLGFGIGYLSSVVIIAVGQYLLGNTFAAVTTVATAAVLANPVAMTCAAVGAVYYGWGALSDRERDDALERLTQGLQLGAELIKSIVGFVVAKIKDLLSPKNIEEIKQYIASVAATFGKSLGDVTHRISDVVGDAFGVAKSKVGLAFDATVETASEGVAAAARGAESAADLVRGKFAKPSAPPTDEREPVNDGAIAAENSDSTRA